MEGASSVAALPFYAHSGGETSLHSVKSRVRSLKPCTRWALGETSRLSPLNDSHPQPPILLLTEASLFIDPYTGQPLKNVIPLILGRIRKNTRVVFVCCVCIGSGERCVTYPVREASLSVLYTEHAKKSIGCLL